MDPTDDLGSLDFSAGNDTTGNDPNGYGLATPIDNYSFTSSLTPDSLYDTGDGSINTSAGNDVIGANGLPSSSLDFGSLGGLLGSAATTAALSAAQLQQLQLAGGTTGLTTGGVFAGGNGEMVLLLAAGAIAVFLLLAKK